MVDCTGKKRICLRAATRDNCFLHCLQNDMYIEAARLFFVSRLFRDVIYVRLQNLGAWPLDLRCCERDRLPSTPDLRGALATWLSKPPVDAPPGPLSFRTFKWLHTNGFSEAGDLTTFAATHRLAHLGGVMPSPERGSWARRAVKWAARQGFRVDRVGVARIAIARGDDPLLEYVVERFPFDAADRTRMYAAAAAAGRVELLHDLVAALGHPLDWRPAMEEAMWAGNIKMMRVLLAGEGDPYHGARLVRACLGPGRAGLLAARWAIQNDYPLGTRDASDMARHGLVDALRLVLDSGVRLSACVYWSAVRCDEPYGVLGLLTERRCPIFDVNHPAQAAAIQRACVRVVDNGDGTWNAIVNCDCREHAVDLDAAAEFTVDRAGR